METIRLINYAITALFFLCYAYQFLYIPVSLLRRPKPRCENSHRGFGLLKLYWMTQLWLSFCRSTICL